MKEIKSELGTLEGLYTRLLSERKRYYGPDWGDWEGGTTGGQPHPCIYVLWQPDESNSPSYVGETVNLGKRLDEHDKETGWSEPRWSHVQYLSDEALEDGEFRQLFECLCIWMLSPKDNNPRRKRDSSRSGSV